MQRKRQRDSNHSRAAEDATSEEKPFWMRRRYAASRAFLARGGFRRSRTKARSISLSRPSFSWSVNDSTAWGSIPNEESSREIPAIPFPAAKRDRTNTSANRASSMKPQRTAHATASSTTSSGKSSRSRRSETSEEQRSLTAQRRSIFFFAFFSSSSEVSSAISSAPASETCGRDAVLVEADEKDAPSISAILLRRSASASFEDGFIYFLPLGFAAGVMASASSGVLLGAGML